MNAFGPPDPDLCRLPPKPPWLICSLVYFVLFVLCLSVCVFVVDFKLYVCSIVLCVLCSGLVIKSVSQLSFDAIKHISCVVFYEDAPHFNIFAFYQLIFVQHDKVNKSETKFSRNARDEAKKMIRNWIGKKTLDSHISFVSIRRWKLLMNGLLGYEFWFNFSYLSAKFMCFANHALVGFFSCTESSKLLGNVPSMLTLSTCNVLYVMKC